MEAWTDNWLKGRVFWSFAQTFDRSVIKTKNIIFILDEKDLGRETRKCLRNKNSSRLEEIILKILITGILADFQGTPKITTNEKFPTLSFKL